MRWLVWLLAALLLAVPPSPAAQEGRDRSQDVLEKVQRVLDEESERLRRDLRDLVRRELSGAPAAEAAPAGTLGRALEAVTPDLLRGHATYLASDELEG